MSVDSPPFRRLHRKTRRDEGDMHQEASAGRRVRSCLRPVSDIGRLGQACSSEQINAWLASEDALIQRIEKYPGWPPEIPLTEASEPVALHFVKRGRSLMSVPPVLRSYRVCLEATSGSEARGWTDFVCVPEEHRKAELVRAAVRKHPDVMRYLRPEQRTLDLYEQAGAQADFETFSKLPVTAQVAATPRYQAVFERLQKRAQPSLDQARPPLQAEAELTPESETLEDDAPTLWRVRYLHAPRRRGPLAGPAPTSEHSAS